MVHKMFIFLLTSQFNLLQPLCFKYSPCLKLVHADDLAGSNLLLVHTCLKFGFIGPFCRLLVSLGAAARRARVANFLAEVEELHI
jgi:hypothetical protein